MTQQSTYIREEPGEAQTTTLRNNAIDVRLRRFPFPYQAALTIASDIDETRTRQEFLEIQSFLNTKRMTPMGEGVGLEIGNSFFFYDRSGNFSFYGQEEEASRRTIIDLIHSGHVDCLHSYGDAATDRGQVVRALEELHRADARVDVWINHHGARTDISRKFEYFFGECRGDDPSSDAYHMDLTLDYGIRYAWVGATTRLIGQHAGRPGASVMTLIDRLHPLSSAKNVLKEARKNVLGRIRNDARFRLQSQGALTQPLLLGDGRRVHEFIRYCNHPVSVSLGATSRGLSYAISRRALAQLTKREGYSIVYAHVGKNEGLPHVVAPETQAALRNLEREYREGRIFVTTTSRLLNYHRASNHLDWSVDEIDGLTRITIHGIVDPVFGREQATARNLQGVTFYVLDRNRAAVYLNELEVQGLRRNAADLTGRESVTVPMIPLEFPN